MKVCFWKGFFNVIWENCVLLDEFSLYMIEVLLELVFNYLLGVEVKNYRWYMLKLELYEKYVLRILVFLI